jgi:uncharacterized membrane protein YesL
MNLTWRVIKLFFSDFIDEILWLALFNIIWCLAAVTVVAFPLASAGMAWVAAEIGEGKVIGLRTFVAGVRRYWKQAYLWGIINLVVIVLIGMNVVFYLNQQESWSTIALMLFGALGLWWLGTQFYFFPFLVHQDPPAIKTAYRNSLVLMLSQPALGVAMFLLAAVLAVLSYMLVFPLLLFFFSLMAVLSNRAVIETIKIQQEREEAAKEKQEQAQIGSIKDRRWRP